MSPQTCHQGAQTIQASYQTEAQGKRKTSCLSERGDHQSPEKIWFAANLPCSKRLKAMVPIWLPGYEQFFGELPAEITTALLQISPSTIDRILKPIRIQYTKRESR
jgi:hypothetical protein